MHRRREDFNSVGGSSICLGHFKNKEHAQADYRSALLKHTQIGVTQQHEMPPKGLGTTKFGKGFHRRSQDQIRDAVQNEGSSALETLEQMEQQRAERQGRTQAIRQRMALDATNRSGYDIISGRVIDNAKCATPKQGLRMLGDGLGPEAPGRGKTVLRESEGRFFTPYPSGHNHEYRQQVLYKEGLLTDKYIGVLELGKKDLPSYGVEDQFSKSEYTKNSAVTRHGLFETRLPGQYTPRKIPGNPAGNDAIVQRWTTGADLSNRTLRGIL